MNYEVTSADIALVRSGFPRLTHDQSFALTSERTDLYNCVAWAAGDNRRWWWPDAADSSFWPKQVRRVETLDAFVELFQHLGYRQCESDTFEPGVEKVALFGKSDGPPTHVARQRQDGTWTSKLGRSEDIKHSVRDLEGDRYGAIAILLSRRVP
jgi:hypothetical protein